LKALDSDVVVAKMLSFGKNFTVVLLVIDAWRADDLRPLTQISHILAFFV